MSERGKKTDLKIGQNGYTLDAIASGKRGFIYLLQDGKRYEVLAGADVRKWVQVLVITITPEPTIIEASTAFPPLGYQLPAGGYQTVSQQNPLPVIGKVDEAAIREAILEATASARKPTGIPIFMDGFDYPLTSWDGAAAVSGALGWDASGAGSIARNTAYKFKGLGCLGITTPAVASAIMRAWKVIPIPESSRRIGLECYMAGQTATENFGSFSFGWRYNSLKNGSYIGYFVEAGSFGVRVVNSPQYPAPLPDLTAPVDCSVFTTNVRWHYAKLIVDLDKGQYVSLTWDRVRKDLSGISAFDAGSFGPATATDLLILQLGAYNAGAAAACLTLYDEVLVTSDEP